MWFAVSAHQGGAERRGKLRKSMCSASARHEARARDALTLFDENAILFACADPVAGRSASRLRLAHVAGRRNAPPGAFDARRASSATRCWKSWLRLTRRARDTRGSSTSGRYFSCRRDTDAPRDPRRSAVANSVETEAIVQPHVHAAYRCWACQAGGPKTKRASFYDDPQVFRARPPVAGLIASCKCPTVRPRHPPVLKSSPQSRPGSRG